MTIRRAVVADIFSMLRLERQCSTAAHWTEQQYRRLFEPEDGSSERLVLVAEASLLAASVPGAGPEAGSSVLGFLVARHLAPEWELENIVVAPAARRKGVGKRLLDALLIRGRETNSDAVFLEVRESNAAARALYEKAGFQQTGRRKSYYTTPPEDAVLYGRSLG